MDKLVIAIDCMGGDFGPSVFIPALKKLKIRYPEVNYLLFGDEELINKKLSQYKLAKSNFLEVIAFSCS